MWEGLGRQDMPGVSEIQEMGNAMPEPKNHEIWILNPKPYDAPWRARVSGDGERDARVVGAPAQLPIGCMSRGLARICCPLHA